MYNHCVYIIACAATGKQYVGLTVVGADKRLRNHKHNARSGRGGLLYAAMRKHGVDAFTVSVLESGLSKTEACVREVALIAELGTLAPDGYNLAKGGESGLLGFVMSDETKAKMSRAHTLRQADPALRVKTSAALTGRAKSAEHLAKIARALTGRTLPNEVRAKICKSNTGKTQSAETIAKRAAKLRGKVKPDHCRNLLGDATRGKPKSADQRRKLSNALKGRKVPPEALAKRAATLARKREERARVG